MEIVIGIVAAVVALIVGLGLGLRLGARNEQARCADLQERLTDAEKALEAERGRVMELSGANRGLEARLEERERAVRQLTEQFDDRLKGVSRDVVSEGMAELLRMAQERFDGLLEVADGRMGTREERIKGLVDPLDKALQRYDQAVQEMERRRAEAYGSLEGRLAEMAKAEQGLQSETNKLVTALRRPEVRGRWGEMTLRNAVEMVGMSEHCDFVEQHSVAADTGVLRPDMIVRLPGGGCIVVDNKVPMDAYLQSLDATDAATREECLRHHVAQCRKHISDLAKKAYWDQFENTPNFVVMFVPMESLYVAAVEVDRDIWSAGTHSNVFVVTPVTLIGLLRVLAHGWHQQTLADNLLEVRGLAGEFYGRLLTFAKHFTGVGKSLGDAVNRYNDAVGSANSRLYLQATRLKELGVPAKEELPELRAIEVVPQALRPELTEGSGQAPDQSGPTADRPSDGNDDAVEEDGDASCAETEVSA